MRELIQKKKIGVNNPEGGMQELIVITICALFILLGFEIRYRQLQTEINAINKKLNDLNDWAVFVRAPEKQAQKNKPA